MADTSTLRACLRAAKEALDAGDPKAALQACKVSVMMHGLYRSDETRVSWQKQARIHMEI